MQQESAGAVPLLDLRRQYEGIREEVLAAIARVCDSQGFILGPEVEALEREIAALTGAAGDRKSTRLNSSGSLRALRNSRRGARRQRPRLRFAGLHSRP